MKYKSMNERMSHDFASSNKFVSQIYFQCTILMCEMYKLWMKFFCTICIIKSWDVEFVMLVLDAKNIFPMHLSIVKNSLFVFKLLKGINICFAWF